MRRRREPPPNDIESALDDLDIDWRASGSNEARGFCPDPNHDDKHPSWYINLDNGLHQCKSCGYRGNWLTLVRDVTGLGTTDAIHWTRERQTISSRRIEEASETIGASRRKREVPEVSESDLWPFTTEIPARYLKRRLLTQASIDEYGVLWDAERESWIIPVRDPDTHELLGWQEKAEDGRYFKNHPKGVQKSRALFGLECAERDSTIAILVESPLDAVRIRAIGIRGAVSAYGVQISDQQLSLLRSRFDSIILALDNDRDGLVLTARLLTELPRVRQFDYQGFTKEERKDPGEMSDGEVLEGIEGAYGVFGHRDARASQAPQRRVARRAHHRSRRAGERRHH